MLNRFSFQGMSRAQTRKRASSFVNKQLELSKVTALPSEVVDYMISVGNII